MNEQNKPRYRAIRRNVRRGAYAPEEVLRGLKKGPGITEKLERWLKGRIAWAAGRKRCGE